MHGRLGRSLGLVAVLAALALALPALAQATIVGAAPTPDGFGWWLVDSSGNVYTYGDAHYYGGAGGTKLGAPIVGIAATPDGDGYWLVGGDGGVFTYGDAHFYGSLSGDKLNKPIVGAAASTAGYWLAGGDGGLFNFNAPFDGSLGNDKLNAPIVGIASDPNHTGYWMVGSDGGVFNFGAPFDGSLGDTKLAAPIAGMTATPSGYLLVGQDGGVFSFDTPFEGSAVGKLGTAPAVAILSSADGKGYLVAANNGDTVRFGDFDVVPTPPSTPPSTPPGSSPGTSTKSGSSTTTLTPSPTVITPKSHRPRRRVHARLVVYYRFVGDHTRIRRARLLGLARSARAALICHGQGCPRQGVRVSSRELRRLVRWLEQRTFRGGDRLIFTFTATGEVAEQLELLIRDDGKPLASLLS
jgi:hypothetical protein